MSNVHFPSRYRQVFPGARSSTVVGGPSKARISLSLLPISFADEESEAPAVASALPSGDGVAAAAFVVPGGRPVAVSGLAEAGFAGTGAARAAV